MGDGATVRQTLSGHVGKLRSTISGQGFIAAGISGLDYTQSMVLKCAKPRMISSATNVIDIPAARRADDAPVGFAIVDGEQVSTPLNIVTDTATLTIVSGATAYQVEYVPEITVLAKLDEGFGTSGGRHTWSLTCVEV
ncbi:MAG: hypothetical protein GY799_25705 [Desulfobulbaceae bacterium]|nr:hypothetical protein [Desulfobulbaceae bacterium]